MRIVMVVAGCALAASVAIASGQAMPGMQMPEEPPKKPETRRAAPGPARKSTATKQSPTPAAAKPDGEASQPAGGSMPGMVMPEDARGTGMKGSGSATHDTMNLQEPEDPSRRTGTNLPAPDLLREVSQRTPISLEEALGLADKFNPTLAQANLLVSRSEAQARQAGAYPNPTVGYYGDEIRGGSLGGGKQGIFAQQTIPLGGKQGLRREVLKQQSGSDRTGAEVQRLRVHRDVTEAFYTTLTAQRAVVVRQRLLGIALDAVETVHQLANVGQADAPDILQAEVEAEQAKIDFESAQREFLGDFRMLASFGGRHDLPVSPLLGDLEKTPAIDTDKEIESMVLSSPTIKRMQQEVLVSEARVRAARREAVPDLTVRLGEDYNREHASEAPVRPYGFESSASAGISLPLWNRNRGNVDAATAETERARKDVEREQLALRETAEPLAQAYLSAVFAVERYRTQLIPRAQRAYELYLAKYQSMAMAYPQVLVSQRTLFQLQLGYLEALHRVWSNAVSLQNFTLAGGLDAPMSSGSASTSINMPGSGAAVE